MPGRVVVRAPASIANLGCLFDAAAMAIEAFYDEVVAEETGGELRVEAEGENVPSGRMNVAYAAAQHLLTKVYGRETGVLIRVRKGVPVGSGLGSSGASAAATVVAVNELLGIGASVAELLEAAGAGEALAAGSAHYDNAAASLLGGIVLIDPQNPRLHVVLEPPSWLHVVVFFRQSPHAQKTKAMRCILPESVSLRDASHWAFTAAAFAAGLARGIKRCISFASDGGIVESVRARSIPGYWEMKRAALRTGALAFNISGAGPSLFALAEEDKLDSIVSEVMKVAPGYRPIVTRVELRGAIRNVESRR
ncbi:MAG: homoserine kinase [Thermofilaceae archaeon]